MYDDYINGFVERKAGGKYEGRISIDGILLDSIVAVYFTQEGKNYLWLKRKPIMEYDWDSETYKTRECKPKWEAYLEKQLSEGGVAYKGEFYFMRFKYSIVGMWDDILGVDKQRLNLYVERMPTSQQTILLNINERNRSQRKG